MYWLNHSTQTCLIYFIKIVYGRITLMHTRYTNFTIIKDTQCRQFWWWGMSNEWFIKAYSKCFRCAWMNQWMRSWAVSGGQSECLPLSVWPLWALSLSKFSICCLWEYVKPGRLAGLIVFLLFKWSIRLFASVSLFCLCKMNLVSIIKRCKQSRHFVPPAVSQSLF